MMRALFVSNGHGEISIAERIALEVRELAPYLHLDHLALVGDGASAVMNDAGPRRSMPSGGLIAMGNVRNIARDVGAGLIGLTIRQMRFLRDVRGTYRLAVAVGDAFALFMARLARAPAIFVGTAKSVNVAPYGRYEERLLAGATDCFVRDAATAQRLREHGIDAVAANVIVDLFAAPGDPRAAGAARGFDPVVALLPGSREGAYADAGFLLDVLRGVARARPGTGGVLSIAPGLEPEGFARAARDRGFAVESVDAESDAVPFEVRDGERVVARAWRGALGPMLATAHVALGQAGTANEAAAAAGLPVIAFERTGDRKHLWYRRRQQGLLGDALAILPRETDAAARGVLALLADDARRARMGAAGRERMGEPGGARRIAERIVARAAGS